MKRTLDWNPRFDEESRKYKVLGGVDHSSKYKYRWPPREVLDQGSEGACVGFACAAAVMGSPLREKFPNNTGFASGVYNFAKFIDYWEGEDYEGTSVLGGAKTLHKLGIIAGYNWCFGVDDIITALHEIGPVVIGIPWYSGMYETDKHHFVHVDGEMVGGHAITIYGYHPKRYRWDTKDRGPVFYWRNSWGKEYGRNGTGYIKREDLEMLLKDNGEACVFRHY